MSKHLVQHLAFGGTPPRGNDLIAILDAGPVSPDDLTAMSKTRRRAAQDGIDALIAALDALDPDPDLEPSFGFLPDGAVSDECEGDFADDEPTLGAPEVEFNWRGVPERHGHVDQRRWTDGADMEDGEREPSYGAGPGDGCFGHRHWSSGYQRDLKSDEAEGGADDDAGVEDSPFDAEPDEPELGSLDGHIDQSRWGGDGINTLSCGACEPSLGAPENPHDQRHWWQGRKGSVELDHDERTNLSVWGNDAYEVAQRARSETKAMLRARGVASSGMLPKAFDPRFAHLPRCS